MPRATRAPAPGLIARLRRAVHAGRLVVRSVSFWSLLAMSTLACHGDGGGPAGTAPLIAGAWSGTAHAYTVHFEATFTQSGQVVGGNGHFSSPLASGDFTVTGTLVGSRVDLVLHSAELGDTGFRGAFTAADRIEGTFDPGGSYESDLTLDRD